MIRRMKKGDMVQPSNLEKDNYQIKEDGYFVSDSQRERYLKIKEAEAFNESVKQNSRDHGGFTFLKITDILTKVDPTTVGRLAYLSTYLTFNHQLLYKGRGIPIYKEDLSKILNVTRPTAADFYKKCIAGNLLIDRESSGLFINEMFFRGESDDEDITRLYCGTIQDLYHRLSAKEHKHFGYAIQIIPMINREWNIVCNNPNEEKTKYIVPLTTADICSKLKMGRGHTERLTEALTSPIFEYEGEEQQLCVSVPGKTSRGKQNVLYVNPHLIYAGSDFTKVDGISVAFRSNYGLMGRDQSKA